MKQKASPLVLFLAVSLVICFSSDSFSQVTKSKTSRGPVNITIKSKHLLPAPKGLVNDFAKVLDGETKAKLEEMLGDFKGQSKIDFAVVTIKTTGKRTAFDYSLAVSKEWNISAEDSDKAGILMLVAVNDRHWHVQITRSLEKIMTNAEVGKWGALMRPFFTQRKYGEGIIKSAEKFIEEIQQRRDVK